jgi:predicted ATPase/DNA-binding SARP family transcriptional activator/DNA-binding CsgD family transcriptional regulator
MLGGFSVSVGHRTIEEKEWRRKKAAALVKLLALAPEHRLHRERVMDMLWPELDAKNQANSMRQALHAARRVLDPGTTPDSASRYLGRTGDLLEMCPGGKLWVDVEAFEEAAAAARRSHESGAYRAALDLYAGDLLPEDRYEEWAEERRERLRGTYLTLLLELAKLYEERGQVEEAIGALRGALVAEPAQEEVHAGLMRLYALSGRRTEALGQYKRLREALSRELGIKPGAASRRLREEILAGRVLSSQTPPVDRAPVELAGMGRHNLPAPRSSFVGREHELVEVKRTLAMTRLLTLTGMGGAGKTRLALEVSRDLLGAYADGVWLVELSGLAEGELVPQSVAEALQVREQPGRPITETLKDRLCTNELLLVMDNCEHLIEDAAHLVDTLLASCPRLRVLATSREPLGVAGEATWQVPSLPVPNIDRLPDVGELTRYDAVRLFVERTRLRLPDFGLTAENAPVVAEVSRKLDGIPLAIELATARVGALSLKQISERLDDSLKTLVSGPRTAPPRQRTMRATLEWSHGLLEDAERKLFGRLSVFSGGWTLEAAEAVGASDGIEEDDVLDLLTRLVDKSLVVVEAGAEDAVRYRMLEPVRQYALEKLEESGETEETRHRHALWCLELAEEAEPKLREAEQLAWLRRLETEHDNLRAALSWALEREGTQQPEARAELGLNLTAAVWPFWQSHRHVYEGRWWLERALSESNAVSTARAKALNGVGHIATFQGEEQAIALLEESLALFRRLGDKPGIASSLGNLGVAVAFLQIDKWRLGALREEAQALLQEPLDRWAATDLFVFLVWSAMDKCDYERAATLAVKNLALNQEVGNTKGISFDLISLGMIAWIRGDYKRAVAVFHENMCLWQKLTDTACGISLLGLAGVAAQGGESVRAARLWGAAEALKESTGIAYDAPFIRYQYDYEGLLTTMRNQLGEAAFERARAEGKALKQDQVVEYALSEEEATPTPSPTPEEPPASADQPTVLTPREEDVAALVAQDFTNRRIAKELWLSERTVENHVRNVLKKLDVPSRFLVADRLTEQRPPP